MLTRRAVLRGVALVALVPVARALAAILKPNTTSVREAMGQGVATRGAGDSFDHVLPPRARYILRTDLRGTASLRQSVEVHGLAKGQRA